jgi:hypothetical protein
MTTSTVGSVGMAGVRVFRLPESWGSNHHRMTIQEALALRIEPRLPGAQDVEAMMNRSIRMQALHQLTRRDNPGHPFHGRFTGLHVDSMTPAPF